MLRHFAIAALILFPVLGLAQENVPVPSSGGKTPLGVRQQRVEQMTEQLERRFGALIQTLQQTEPERADRLKKTLDEAKKLQLKDRMAFITRSLDAANLETATDKQKEVLADIRRLLALLLDEKSDKDKAREEFERLQEWKKNIEKIIQEEKGEKREADKLAAKDKTLAGLEAKIKAIQELIEKQQGIIAATQAAREEGIQAVGKIAPKQEQVRTETKKVADEIAKEAGDTLPPDAKPEEGEKPAEGAKPAEGSKPSEESKPKAGSKPSEGGKPSEGSKPSDGDTPSEGGQPGEGSQPSSSTARPPEPGERPLRQATENQKNAAANLQQGKGKAAQQDEQTALDNLKRALGELKKEHSRIATLPPEAFDKLAKKQEEIAQKTGDLQEKMKEAQKGSQGGEKGSGQSGGKPQPGQKQVQQAQKQMQQAGGDLKKQDPEGASRQEQKAIKELEQALQEIEERLAQLREETQLEKLARLEGRFREMLTRQQKTTIDTSELEKRKADNQKIDRLAHNPLVKEESSLADAAQQALDIIIDDGTSVVFPDVVEQLRNDLYSVAKLLEGKKTDAYTHTMQKEIETTLEELIEALQQAQKQKEGSGGGGGGGGGEPPLLPNSAELKLLRAAQFRVNRRTQSFDTNRPKEGLDDVLKGEIQNIARRQAEIQEMTIKILERTESP